MAERLSPFHTEFQFKQTFFFIEHQFRFMLKKTCIILFIAVGRIMLVNGQDLHYSQFYYNSHNLSPSTIGQFDGDDRVTLNYRNQWLSLPVPYNTISFLYDGNRFFKKNKSSYGFGFGLDYDRAGDSKLRMARLVLAMSYSPFISKQHHLSIGFTPSIAQRRLSEEGLRWDKQWNGDRYDPKISSSENFATSGDFFIDLGAGLSYQFNLTNRTKLL